MTRPETQQQRSATRAEVQQAINDAREAATTAARDAQEAARDAQAAAKAAQPGAPPAPPVPPRGPGRIVIPTDGGDGNITINVDGQGIHLTQDGRETIIPIRDIVPRGAVQITWGVFGSLAFMVVGYPLARAFARWLDRRGSATQVSREVQARLDAMERNIDTVAVELERVSEGQRFTAKLLEQRPLEHAQRIDR
jgi:hypothetical protein